jgi:P-type conjugative transfer protein TrbJ
MIRRALLCTTAILALAGPAHSQTAVVCANCATSVQKATDLLTQVKQYAEELQTDLNTLNTYKQLIMETASLPFSVYQDASSFINTIKGFTQAGSMSGSNPLGMINSLGSTSFQVTDIANRITMETNAISNAADAARQAFDQSDDQDFSGGVEGAEAQSAGTTGTTSAVQAGNQINATGWQTLQTQQQAMIAGTQALVTAQVAAADHDAAERSLETQQRNAGITAACSAASQTGAGIQVSWCNN